MEKNLNTTKKLGVSFKSGYSNLELHVYGDTINELIEGLSMLRDGAFINYFVFKFKTLTEEQLLRLDDIMLTTDNAEEILEYAKRRKEKINTQKYQDRLIELKDMRKLVNFTAFAIGVNIEKTEDAVIAYGDVGKANMLIREIDSVNIKKMKEFIFEKGRAYEVYDYIRNLKIKDIAININEMREAKKIVIESQNMQTIRFWAKSIGDVAEMEDITVQYGDTWDMYSFAKEVKNADIERIRVEIAKKNCKELMQRLNLEFPKPIIKKSFFDRFNK